MFLFLLMVACVLIVFYSLNSSIYKPCIPFCDFTDNLHSSGGSKSSKNHLYKKTMLTSFSVIISSANALFASGFRAFFLWPPLISYDQWKVLHTYAWAYGSLLQVPLIVLNGLIPSLSIFSSISITWLWRYRTLCK